MVNKEQIRKFEIADLRLQESDSIYAAAVRCVQTYWKQATRMTLCQRNRYIGYLQCNYQAKYLLHPPSPESHILYKAARGSTGKFPALTLYWADYLLLSSLYDHLPQDYAAAIASRYTTSVIHDYTIEYRRLYRAPAMSQKKNTAQFTLVLASNPALTPVMFTSTGQQNTTANQVGINGVPTSTGQQQSSTPLQKTITPMPVSTGIQQPNATPTQKKANNVPVAASQEQNATPPLKNNVVMPTSTGIQQQNLAAKKKAGSKAQISTSQKETHTPSQKKAVVPAPTGEQKQDIEPPQESVEALPASIIQQENNLSAGTQLAPASQTTAQSVKPEIWDINNVVDTLGQVKKKRLSSAPESSPKRVKVNDNELLDQVNQETTITQKSVDQLRTIVEDQGARLQGVSTTAEQNKQTLSDMRSELRQFMSAVASILRDIQERLEE